MRMVTFWLAATVTMSLVASAHDAGCPPEPTNLTVHTLAKSYYVVAECEDCDGALYEETNGHPGLQSSGDPSDPSCFPDTPIL